MAGNPKKKSTGIVNAAIGALAVVLAILIVWMMNLVSGIQGTARIINYAGLVRGKTRRIVKLEISGQPQDGMIADIDAFIAGLRFGSDELSLVRLNDDAFQRKMQELDDQRDQLLHFGVERPVPRDFAPDEAIPHLGEIRIGRL